MALRLLVALACLSFATAVRAQQPTPPDAIEKLVARLEQALANADRPALLALAVKDADATSLDDFAAATSAKPTRVVIKERDRMPLEGKRQQILIEVFVERGIEAQALHLARRAAPTLSRKPMATTGTSNGWSRSPPSPACIAWRSTRRSSTTSAISSSKAPTSPST